MKVEENAKEKEGEEKKRSTRDSGKGSSVFGGNGFVEAFVSD